MRLQKTLFVFTSLSSDMISLSRKRERLGLGRGQILRTTLTFRPLPRSEGEETISSSPRFLNSEAAAEVARHCGNKEKKEHD